MYAIINYSCIFDELIDSFFLSHYKVILPKDPWRTPARASTYKPLQVSIYYVFLIISGTWCTFHNSNTCLLFFYCQWHYAWRASAGNWFTCVLLSSLALLIPFSASLPDASQVGSIPSLLPGWRDAPEMCKCTNQTDSRHRVQNMVHALCLVATPEG